MTHTTAPTREDWEWAHDLLSHVTPPDHESVARLVSTFRRQVQRRTLDSVRVALMDSPPGERLTISHVLEILNR